MQRVCLGGLTSGSDTQPWEGRGQMSKLLRWMCAVTSGFCVWNAEPAYAQESPAPLVDIHGFVSQGFIKSTDHNYLGKSERGSFEFTEVGLNVTKELGNNLRVGVQLFARDLGTIGNLKPQFDWFYLDYRFFDWFGLRAGRTKLPFGLFNEVNDVDSARVPILLPQSLYPVQNRDYLLAQNGLELYGNVPLGIGGGLEYRLYGGTIFLDTSTQPIIVSLDIPYVAGGRLMWSTPLRGLDIGGSLQTVRLDVEYLFPPQFVADIKAQGRAPASFNGYLKAKLPVILWVGSALYQSGELLLAAEYSRWRANIDSSVPGLFPTETENERLYGMASYRVNDWFWPGTYYSLMFPDVLATRQDRANQQHDLAVTTRFDVTENWLVKLEGHYMWGTAALNTAENSGVPLANLDRVWAVFLAKTTAYF